MSDGDNDKEGDGDSNMVGGQATAAAMKRAMASVTRVASDNEGNDVGGKRDGTATRLVGKQQHPGQWQWQR